MLRFLLARVPRLLLLATALVIAAPAYAMADDGKVVIPFAWASIYLAPLLPILTAFITKERADGWVKMLVTTIGAGLLTVVATAVQLNEDVIFTWDTLGRIGMSFGVAMLSYLLLRKPLVDPIASAAAPDKGIG